MIHCLVNYYDNRNNNDLKDGQNDRLEKKETLIRTRNWSGLYAFEEYKHYTENSLKWATVPGMDRWEILILALICNVNQSNEQYITLIQGCIRIKSQHPIR